MLLPAKNLKALKLEAKDGPVGSVNDLYFDDEDWTVRHLVLSTGSRLSGRQVLISPHPLGKPDLAQGSIPANLTREKVEQAPGPETDKPVSRQMEARYHDYFDYPYYWRGPYIWGGAAFPFYPSTALPPDPVLGSGSPKLSARKKGNEDSGDPHLRSANEVARYDVEAVDGAIGHIQDFLVDEESWSIRYLIVDTTNWLPGGHVVVPVDWARDIRWSDRKVTFRHPKEEVRRAPKFPGTAGEVTPEFTEYLDAFYERCATKP